ncbi:MAG: ion transporter [Acidobacteriota bacterium]|nr:ion transporter [Acidobacteriota bacterium]
MTRQFDYRTDARLAGRPKWRRECYRIIFEHDTPGGRLFDITLILLILASVAVVMVESVQPIAARHGRALRAIEWGFTVIFTVEYFLRLASAPSAFRYARSFFGVVDLLAILPTFLALVVPGGQALSAVRILRVLRIFRVLKLAQFIGSEVQMLRALRQSAYKIAVFLFAVVTIVVVVGAVMYVIEGAENGFTSIPRSVYWAVVTVTTVGFGDITPSTVAGQFMATLLMIVGYGIIAVPTGIVSAEMVARRARRERDRELRMQLMRDLECSGCGATEHVADGVFCRHCGTVLPTAGGIVPRDR